MAEKLSHDRSTDERRPAGGFTFAPGSEPLAGYTLKRGLGQGGFGEVYYALSTAGKEVALKVVRRHLDVELRGVSQCLNLKHPNLVAVYDVRTDAAGNHWIVMEYVAGEKLSDVLDRSPGGLGVEAALTWLRGIAAGTQYLHDNGIVHRDLKPANLFLEQGLVKIGDYGLSKFISVSRRSGHTESVGTVHYMAPEISSGRYGKEIDVYSLGVMLHEMLTGRVPFEGESVGEILMKHLTAEPDLRGVAEPYRGAIAAALEKDPARRPTSVAEFLRCVDGEPGKAPPLPKFKVEPPSRDPHAPKPRLLRLYAGVAAAVLFGLLLIMLLLVRLREGYEDDYPSVPSVDVVNATSTGASVEMIELKIDREIEHTHDQYHSPRVSAAPPAQESHSTFVPGIFLTVTALALFTSSLVAAGVWFMRRTITASNIPPPPSGVEIYSAPAPFTWRGWATDVTGAWLLTFVASIVAARLLLLIRGDGPTLEQFVWTAAAIFGATALAAAIGKSPQAARLTPLGHRLMMTGVGIATGAAAWLLVDYLRVALPFETELSFVGTRQWPECYRDGRPTVLAFVGYFGLTFFLVDWRSMISFARGRTWQFGNTAVAVFWAAVVNAFFPFPQLWGFAVVAGCTLTFPLAFPTRARARRHARRDDD